MPKLPALYKIENGTYKITDGEKTIGSLIPVVGSENQLFTIKMGEYGGFWAVEKKFDDALAFLLRQHIRVYTNKMESVRRGANLIYKKSLKP